MSRPITSDSQAFYTRKTEDSMLLLYWSSGWCSRRPWSYNGEPIHYIDKRIELRENWMMSSRAIGPLMIVYCKKVLHSN